VAAGRTRAREALGLALDEGDADVRAYAAALANRAEPAYIAARPCAVQVKRRGVSGKPNPIVRQLDGRRRGEPLFSRGNEVQRWIHFITWAVTAMSLAALREVAVDAFRQVWIG